MLLSDVLRQAYQENQCKGLPMQDIHWNTPVQPCLQKDILNIIPIVPGHFNPIHHGHVGLALSAQDEFHRFTSHPSSIHFKTAIIASLFVPMSNRATTSKMRQSPEERWYYDFQSRMEFSHTFVQRYGDPSSFAAVNWTEYHMTRMMRSLESVALTHGFHLRCLRVIGSDKITNEPTVIARNQVELDQVDTIVVKRSAPERKECRFNQVKYDCEPGQVLCVNGYCALVAASLRPPTESATDIRRAVNAGCHSRDYDVLEEWQARVFL